MLIFKRLAWVGVIAGLLCGCKTEPKAPADPMVAWHASDFAKAAHDFTLAADAGSDGKDAVLLKLEEAAALRPVGRFQESTELFDQIEHVMDSYALEAQKRLAPQVLLSEPTEQTYVGRTYDKIMTDTYKALNDLQLGETEAARADLQRAEEREKSAVSDNVTRIAAVQKKIAKENVLSDDMAVQVEKDPRVRTQIDGLYSPLTLLRHYGAFANPFTIYLNGLFTMYTTTNATGLEWAQKSLERCAAFYSNNACVQADLQTVRGLIAGEPVAPVTYVILETGLAPIRQQVQIGLPLFAGADASYLPAALPVLRFAGGELPVLVVSGGGVSQSTSTICSMDSVIGHEFQADVPDIVSRTIAATIAKAAAGTNISAIKNEADTRTWANLPKEFEICRLPTPPDRHVQVSSPFGSPQKSIHVMEGMVNVIYVKSITKTGSLEISQFRLK